MGTRVRPYFLRRYLVWWLAPLAIGGLFSLLLDFAGEFTWLC